jgi:hypothetical protein
MKIQKTKKLYLYTVFHLNLAYSSIPEKDHPRVLERCYWPLLRLCGEMNIPLGIEASGYTLEKINDISPSWVVKLREFWKNKKCEFIGSGYSQIIGPLVPAEVNSHNLKIGNLVYQSLLGKKPEIVYVSEQAYSQGLIEHYLKARYKAIIAEWNNPFRYHPEWKGEWRYYPQLALNQSGKTIPLIWNNSIAFQKFQRYVYGELELEKYIDYLKSQLGKSIRFFPLYGNDVEIFDYRPGRYSTEVKMNKEKEWKRIEKLFEKLSKDPDLEIITPSKVLKLAKKKLAFNQIRLESAEQPIPVKKQEKYNITRWALTGRDDLGINTKCYQIYKYLKSIEKGKKNKIDLWKELCFLWGSDFRTHAEENKFLTFQKRLDRMLSYLKNISSHERAELKRRPKKDKKTMPIYQPTITRQNKMVTIETECSKINLNCQRGLTIDSLTFKGISDRSLIGTLPHGYYDDISLGADYYTDHTIIEVPGKQKITDLDPVYSHSLGGNLEYLPIKANIKVGFGTISKTILVYIRENRIDLNYEFDFENLPLAVFHSGIITFNPEDFDLNSLYYGCHNGGREKEIFPLSKIKSINSGPVSFLVSSQNALGNTQGHLEIGDRKKSIILKTDMERLAVLPMINFIRLSNNFFLRVLFSLGEIDDTVPRDIKKKIKTGFKISIIAYKK